MSNILAISLLTLSVLCQAEIKLIKVEGLFGNLQNETGEIRSTLFEIEKTNSILSSDNLIIDLKKDEKKINFSFGIFDITLTDNYINDSFNQLTIDDLNIKIDNQAVIFTFFNFSNRNISLSKFDINCQRSVPKSSPIEIIQTCLKEGSISSKSLNLTNTMTNKTYKNQDINLSISDGSFTGSFLTSTKRKVKVNFLGDIIFNKNDQIFQIHLKKFNIGVINFRSQVLKKIKSLNHKNVTVSGNNIFIKKVNYGSVGFTL